MRKQQEQRNDIFLQNPKPSTSRSFPPCPHCQRTNHPPKNAGAVPMPLIEPNISNRIIQPTTEIMDKKKEIPPIQDLYQFSKTPSVVWQQQIEKAYIQRYINMHMIHKTLPAYEHDYRKNFDTQFRPLPGFIAYDTFFLDPQYVLDPYWDENLDDQDKLEYKITYNKPMDQIESDALLTDGHVSDALRYALIDLWTVSPHLPDTLSLPNFQPRPQHQQRHIAVIND